MERGRPRPPVRGRPRPRDATRASPQAAGARSLFQQFSAAEPAAHRRASRPRSLARARGLLTGSLVIFYVRRTLPSGLIRFGSGERSATPGSGDGSLFSTGAGGEFRRRGDAGLYFVEERGEAAPKFQSSEHYIREQSALSLRAKLLIGGGAVLAVWGLIVMLVAPHLIVLILLILPGVAMIGFPIWKSMKLRRELRAKAERERAEREETER